MINVSSFGSPYESVASSADKYFAIEGKVCIELVFCSAEEIRELNLRTRGTDSVTDVLSFPALSLEPGNYPPFDAKHYPYDVDPQTGEVCLGSIAICEEVAREQAAEYGHSEDREKGYLFLHGLLHLLGFDHIEQADRQKMREAEEAILAAVGLKRE